MCACIASLAAALLIAAASWTSFSSAHDVHTHDCMRPMTAAAAAAAAAGDF